MSESAPATINTIAPAPMSQTKVIIIKVIALTVISLGLGFTHTWASTRCYQPDYVAGVPAGMMEGAIMPAALPPLLMGHDVPIYAPNNVGRGYKIGFILGLNTSGTIFFGVAFWKPRKKR